MKFKYSAITKEGGTITGEMDAKDKFDLARVLKEEGKIVTIAEEMSEKTTPFLFFAGQLIGRVSLRDKIIFMRNLGAMLDAGLPLMRALGVLQKQTRNKNFQSILKEVGENIGKGGTLAGAFEKHIDVFSPLAVAMTHAGEESGKLPESLIIISEHLERAYLLRKRIRGALMYPSIVLTAMVLIGVLMLVYIVPTLEGVFKELNVELPRTTRSIIFASTFLKDNTIIAFMLLAGMIVSLRMLLHSKKGKYVFEGLLLHTPVIGELTKQANSARTARTLSSLLSSGVKMVEALSITHDVVQNSHYKAILKDAEDRVQKGTTLSQIFSEYENVYPILVGEMTLVGEETGQLSGMLMKVAKFYEDEVETQTKDMSTIIEPILMVIVGVGVGFFAVSMITPLYSVLEGI